MKSITLVSPLLVILMAMPYSPAAYSFGVDPGVVSREINRSSPTLNQQNNSSQPYVYQYQPSQQNSVTIDRKNKVKRK